MDLILISAHSQIQNKNVKSNLNKKQFERSDRTKKRKKSQDVTWKIIAHDFYLAFFLQILAS